MAKAKDLAGLAALGVLGAMMSNKSGGDSNPDRGAGYNSTETRDTPRRQITDYMAKAPDDGGGMSVREAGSEAPQAADQVFAAPMTQKAATVRSSAAPAPVPNVTPVVRQKTPGGVAKRSGPPAQQGPSQADLMAAYVPRYTPPMMAPRTVQGAQPQPYQPGDVDNSYPGRPNYKKGGAIKKMASGGLTSKVSSASRRGDGIASRGKTRGKLV